MNTGEFNGWLKRHQALFPKLAEWLGLQPEPAVILAAWAKVLVHCQAAHAAEATERMLRGIDPVVRFNDWSELPAAVISHCKLMGSGKVERTGDANYVSGAALRGALRTILETPSQENESQAFEEFRGMIDGMERGELRWVKTRITDAMDAGKFCGATTLRLLNMADEKHKRL